MPGVLVVAAFVPVDSGGFESDLGFIKLYPSSLSLSFWTALCSMYAYPLVVAIIIDFCCILLSLPVAACHECHA